MTKAAAAAKRAPEPGFENIEELGALARAWRLGGRDYLPYRITLLAKLFDRWNTRLLQESSGLSVAEWRVLAQLSNASPASVRQLAEQAWVDRAEVSRAAASLERSGYVERRNNPKDRRSPLLYCSELGRALARRVSPVRHDFHKSMTDLLSDEQAEVFERAMLLLARHCMDGLDAGPSPGPAATKQAASPRKRRPAS
jgi:DNA-binding MarR family transcriptional regulator